MRKAFWAEDLSIGYKTISARTEAIATKPNVKNSHSDNDSCNYGYDYRAYGR
jgi:hypothetical protein